MTCAEASPLIDAYFDSELDLASALSVERHLAECHACSTTLQNLERLREELTPSVFNRIDDSDLRPLRQSVRRLTGARPARKPAWSNPAIWGAVAAALLFAVVLPLQRPDPSAAFNRELVDSHVRSLLAQHLVDVPSSDQHTVKPWFQGKVDFAPDVPDFKSQGYELIGGRLDVVGGHPAAAIVYKRGGHFINLWTFRATATSAPLTLTTLAGYHLAHWTDMGLDRWAVTDMNALDLRAFVELYRSR